MRKGSVVAFAGAVSVVCGAAFLVAPPLRVSAAEGITQSIENAEVQDGAWARIFDRQGVGKKEDIFFADSLNGWLVEAAGNILRTSNGGSTWEVQATGISALRSVEFLDNMRGFAGTLSGQLHSTMDGGKTWKNITSLLPGTPKGFCGMAHVGDKVHLVGRYTGYADYYYSPDAGKTWEHRNLSAVATGLVDVVFLNERVGLIGGQASLESGAPLSTAMILKTTDGGRSWVPVFRDTLAASRLWKFSVVSPEVIYGSIERPGHLEILKSRDAGNTWQRFTVATGVPRSNSLQGIGFIDERTGWVGGFLSGMYATADSGKTWNHVPVDGATFNQYARVGDAMMTAGSTGVFRYRRK